MSEQEKSDKHIVCVDPDIKEFVPEYLENRKRDIDTIRANLANDDFENIRSLGHKMKGSGKLYGLEQVTTIGASLEQAAEKKDRDEIEKLWRELSAYLDEVELR